MAKATEKEYDQLIEEVDKIVKAIDKKLIGHKITQFDMSFRDARQTLETAMAHMIIYANKTF